MEALQNGQTTVEGSIEGQSAGAASHAMIEKILSEEPRWQETAYVLGNYKTEPCKKPPRLCRQGYACPYYHNSKDRRRSPRKHKYRSSGPGRPAAGGGAASPVRSGRRGGQPEDSRMAGYTGWGVVRMAGRQGACRDPREMRV